jgi:outer membrane protein OmpA-like peptidoglycan-associated protein
MRFVNYLLLCLCIGNANLVQAAKKPVTFRVFISGKVRPNALVTWSKQSGTTNGAGEITFQKSACDKRNKGEKIHLSILLRGLEEQYTCFVPDTVIVLDAPITVIHCEQELLRKSEQAIQRKQDNLEYLKKKNQALAQRLDSLETRVLKQLEIHPKSLVGYYEKWITRHIELLRELAPKIEEQQNDLAELSRQGISNQLKLAEVTQEVSESAGLEAENSPIDKEIEAILPEINITLDNDPDFTLNSSLLFGRGTDTLKPESTQALSEYAVQRKTQLIGIIEEESTRTKALRTRVCVVQLTGFADSFRMVSCVNKPNHTCESGYKDAKDGNLCLSWCRANRVKEAMLPLLEQEVVQPLKEQGMRVELQMQPAVGMGRQYALKDTTGNQDDWRKCTISMIYMSKAFFDQYVAVLQPLGRN